MTVNRLITRGMGTSRGAAGVAGMVTQGYGGFFRKVKDALVDIAKKGRSSARKVIQEIEEIVVWAKLIRVNDSTPPKLVQGYIAVKVDEAKNFVVKVLSGLTASVKATVNDIKITIKRLK